MQQNTETIAVEKPVENLFSKYQWLFFVAIIIAGLFLRWVGLGARPVHHDESLHMMYGRYFYDFPDIQYYKYDPMLHGPFLYNALRLVYSTLGSSTAAARAFPALIGSFFLFLPFIFRRYFSNNALILLTAAIALSPTLTYWSRFIREDMPMLAALALLLYGCTIASPRYRFAFGIVSFALQVCMKENVFVTAALLIGYLLYEAVIYLLCLGEKDTLLFRIFKNLKNYPWHALGGLVLGSGIYCYFFSAGFRYPKGMVEFFTRSVSYWMAQHNIERIRGPFNFHFYVLSWYELPFVLAVIAAIVVFYVTARTSLRTIGAITTELAAVLGFHYINRPVEGVFPWSFFKLKDAYDVVGLLILVPHAVLLPTAHALRKERALAFWSYLFGASFFAYSYLGEKVPWLSVYPFIPGLIYIALLFDAFFSARPVSDWQRFPIERILSWIGTAVGALTVLFIYSEGMTADNQLFCGFAVAFYAASFCPRFFGRVNLYNALVVAFCVYSLRANILTNFVYAGEAREYLSQVHTTPQFNSLIQTIRKEATDGIKGYKPLIYATGESVWPITWYLVDIPEYKFVASDEERKKFTYQFIDSPNGTPEEHPGFKSLTIPLRGWWVPDFAAMTPKKFLDYSLNHTPWGDTGFTNVTLLVKDKE